MNKKYNDMFVDLANTIMDRKEITKVGLSNRIGVNEQTLSRYLLKKRNMPLETAVLIALDLKIDLNALYGLVENPLNEEEYKKYLQFKELFQDDDE